MDEQKAQSVYWTDRSLSDSLVIKQYLLKYFTDKEVGNFYKMLGSFEKIVLSFPELYPKSPKNKKFIGQY